MRKYGIFINAHVFGPVLFGTRVYNRNLLYLRNKMKKSVMPM